MKRPAWQELGAFRSSDLVEERVQLHWAAQPLSALTALAIDAQPGDEHTNLGWDHEESAFVTQPFPGGYRAALGALDFSLRWRDPDGTGHSRFELKGNTLATGLRWLSDHIRTTIGNLPQGDVQLRDYDMPAHGVANGQAFDGGDKRKRKELVRWFANADVALGEIARANEGSSEPRTWPHHFDTGLLINFEPDRDPEQARSIGVGLSPGDEQMPQPYFYVIPYPLRRADDLPPMPGGGRWEREAFFGAVLTGDALIDGGEAAEQHGRTREFLIAAVEACKGLLGF